MNEANSLTEFDLCQCKHPLRFHDDAANCTYEGCQCKSFKEGQMVSTAIIQQSNLAIERDPELVLTEAHKAAQALKRVIDAKPRKVIFNQKVYLEYEDWLTVARFYGVTVKVRETHFIEYGEVKGFEAVADALLVSKDQVISSADAMCLNDEPNWSTRKGNPVPLFQLRSMAQTRACAKALRNVLAWVVVLAGYAPTPAEEMQGEIVHEFQHNLPADAHPNTPQAPKPSPSTSGAQGKKAEVLVSPSGDMATIIGWLDNAVSRQDKKKREYLMLTIDDVSVSCFDNKLWAAVQAYKGQDVKVFADMVKKDDRTFYNLISLVPLNSVSGVGMSGESDKGNQSEQIPF